MLLIFQTNNREYIFEEESPILPSKGDFVKKDNRIFKIKKIIHRFPFEKDYWIKDVIVKEEFTIIKWLPNLIDFFAIVSILLIMIVALILNYLKWLPNLIDFFAIVGILLITIVALILNYCMKG